MHAELALNLPAASAFLDNTMFAGLKSDAPFARRLNSRIGHICYDPSRVVSMPRGIFGFGSIRESILLRLDPSRFGPLNLLQVIDEPRLAFLFYADTPESSLYQSADLDAAYQSLGIPQAYAAALVLATVRPPPTGITLNLRAPLLVNTQTKVAIQHILASGDYPIRFKP
jgi:flagellar assembly factor FliW